MFRGAVAQLRRNARGPARRRRTLTTKKRDPAVAHAQDEAVRRNWNPFAFDVSLNSPYLWGAAACVALVATAWDEAETESEESEQESVFLDDEDWEMHVSLQNCHFQSVDCRAWHEIVGSVPKPRAAAPARSA